MRKALLGSLVFHIVLTIVFFQVIAFTQVKWVPREVYEVKLVSGPAPARASAPKVEKAPPKPVPEPEKKVEEKEDQMPAPPEKKKPPKPVEKKQTSSVPTTDIRKTDAKPDSALAGSAATGTATDAPAMGDVSVDGGDFPFASYINRMRQKIATAWQVPPATVGAERSVVVYFRVHRNGSVSNVTVEKSSDLPLFDRSCQRAVIDAAPLPPLPREYQDEYLGVHFSFLYQPNP